ncbi:unnamed protein product [Rhodiola kirilowii]
MCDLPNFINCINSKFNSFPRGGYTGHLTITRREVGLCVQGAWAHNCVRSKEKKGQTATATKSQADSSSERDTSPFPSLPFLSANPTTIANNQNKKILARKAIMWKAGTRDIWILL